MRGESSWRNQMWITYLWNTDFFNSIQALQIWGITKTWNKVRGLLEYNRVSRKLTAKKINSAAVCAHSLEGQLHPWAASKEVFPSGHGRWLDEDRVKVRVSTQEWCGPVRGRSEKGYKGDQRYGATLLQREAERHGVVQHGEEVVYGDLIAAFQNLKDIHESWRHII